MSVPLGSTMATAMVQWFFTASANAAAAAFLALSTLMGVPYGFDICASIPSAQNASVRIVSSLAIRDDIVACSSSFAHTRTNVCRKIHSTETALYLQLPGI